MTGLTKMTFKVYSKLWESFDAQIGALPIKRDPFLSAVIKREVPRLATAMEGKRLSGKANRHVSDQLTRLGTITVNIGVESDIAAELKRIVAECHMARDGFFNRLIAFLRSSDFLLDFFELPKKENGSALKTWANIEKSVSPLTSLESVFDDPLWYLHEAVQETQGTNLYLLQFPSPKLDGFACWMDDSCVPGTRQNKKALRELADIELGISEFEFDAFTPAKGR